MIRKYNYIIMIALVLLGIRLNAQEQTKELFNKTYSVNNKSLSLDNTFGNMTISVWDKKEYAVLVELKMEGFSEKEASKLLDKVQVKSSENSDDIKIMTDWTNQNLSSNGKKSFEINYQVKTPINANLKLKNSFGNLSIADFNGPIALSVEYGNLNTGKLKEGDIELSFGNGNIDALMTGEIEVKYADKLSIGRLGNVVLESGFSQVTIENADHINLEGKYGEVKIGTINSIEGSSSFSGLEIGLLKKKVDMEAKYVSGKLEIEHVDPAFESIAIESKFSQINIVFDPKCNFNFQTESKFGKLKHDSPLTINYANTEDYSEEFKGFMGKKDSSARVYVSTSYGDVKLEVK